MPKKNLNNFECFKKNKIFIVKNIVYLTAKLFNENNTTLNFI